MQAINRIIAPLKRGLQLLVSRAVVSVVNDAYARQNLQLRLQSDEVADDVERFQNYGHYSVPKAGEAIVVSVGGKRSHLVAVVVDDKSVRPAGLIAGDSVLYHLEGHQLRLTKNGEAILSCTKFTIETDTLDCSAQQITFDSPQTTFTGNVDIMGISTATDHQSSGISGKDHDHEKRVGKPVP